MAMNLPNKLTVIRAIMILPFLYVLLLNPFGEYSRIIAVIIFVVASVTDALDGHIARKYNLVTNFGKFMDPLADKLLVSAGLISLTALGDLSPWVVIVIISREFIITGFRTVAADANIVIAASNWGKAKTIVQMIMLPYVMLGFQDGIFLTIKNILVTISVILTIISAVDYIVKNREVLKA